VTEPRHSAVQDPAQVKHRDGRRYTLMSLDNDQASEDEEFITSVVHNETMKQGAHWFLFAQ